MASPFKGVSIFTFLAIALLIIAGILHIVGVATPNWHQQKTTTIAQNQQLTAHKGLWASCGSIQQDIFDCTSHSNVEGYIHAVRFFEIMALLFGAAAIVLTALWAFMKIEKMHKVIVMSSILCAFLASAFAILGVIIYGAKLEENKRDTSQLGFLFENTVDYSLILCVVSGCLSLLGAVLLVVGSRAK